MTEDDELFADMPRVYIRGLEKGKGYVKENYLRERREWIKLRPVSYTHLTLPTIYSV